MLFQLSPDLRADVNEALGKAMGESGRVDVFDGDQLGLEQQPVAIGTWRFIPGEGFVGQFKTERCTRSAVVTLHGSDGRFIRQNIGYVDGHMPYDLKVTLSDK